MPAPTADGLGRLWAKALTTLKKLAGRSAVDTWLLKAELTQLERDSPHPDAADLAPAIQSVPEASAQHQPARQAAPVVYRATLTTSDSQIAQFIDTHYLAAVQRALATVLGGGAHVHCRICVHSGPTAALQALSSRADPNSQSAELAAGFDLTLVNDQASIALTPSGGRQKLNAVSTLFHTGQTADPATCSEIQRDCSTLGRLNPAVANRQLERALDTNSTTAPFGQPPIFIGLYSGIAQPPAVELPFGAIAPTGAGEQPNLGASTVGRWPELTDRFTFAQFVVGKANELATSAALAVAQSPGSLYNPLFVHGGVGLGKTHLLHAIGNWVTASRPDARVRYVAAETFVDDVFSAWNSRDRGARGEVRAHYRDNVDVLLLDDVQFLHSNEKVQEEFFHVFNALHNAGKQIVLSSDRYPSELQGLHDRLRSRFGWGLVAELTPPDRDLRIAILRRKAQDMQLGLPTDVVLYLADHLRNNVRELEGALHKLAAHARMGRRAIDLGLARSALGPLIELPCHNLTAEVIQRVTAQHFGIKITDLKGGKRHRGVVVPRMIAMHLVRKHTSASFPEIGRLFGGRDHTTVMHGCRKMLLDVAAKMEVQAAVQAIETALGK
ncbi:MAG: chromosomal replication initiator protein DnaA [Myxococcales bacterium]|nr:chromosomal replication initiator protein DnaA [Myxococcales bacterium]